MKKAINKLFIVILSMVFFIVTNSVVSSAANKHTITVEQKNGDTKKIENDYDLAEYAKEHSKAFVNCNLNEQVGKKIDLYYPENDNDPSTIDLKTAACMYHDQSGNKSGIYTICNVIDIEGRHAIIYGEDGDSEATNTLIGSMGRAIYKIFNYNKKNNETWRNFSWKSILKNIFINEKNGLKKKVDDGFLQVKNPDAESMYQAVQWDDAINSGEESGNPANKPEKKPTTFKLNKDRIHWPFKNEQRRI